MKIKNLKIKKKLINIFNKEKQLEKQIDNLQMITSRNKLMDKPKTSIDDVVSTSRKLNLTYRVYL